MNILSLLTCCFMYKWSSGEHKVITDRYCMINNHNTRIKLFLVSFHVSPLLFLLSLRLSQCFLPLLSPAFLLTHLGLLPKLLSIDFLHLHLCIGLLVHCALHQQSERKGRETQKRKSDPVTHAELIPDSITFDAHRWVVEFLGCSKPVTRQGWLWELTTHLPSHIAQTMARPFAMRWSTLFVSAQLIVNNLKVNFALVWGSHVCLLFVKFHKTSGHCSWGLFSVVDYYTFGPLVTIGCSRAMYSMWVKINYRLCLWEWRNISQTQSTTLPLHTTSPCSSSRVFRRIRTGLATATVPLVSRCPMADGSTSSRLLALTMTSTPWRDSGKLMTLLFNVTTLGHGSLSVLFNFIFDKCNMIYNIHMVFNWLLLIDKCSHISKDFWNSEWAFYPKEGNRKPPSVW